MDPTSMNAEDAQWFGDQLQPDDVVTLDNLLGFLTPIEPLATVVDAITALDPASKIQNATDYAYEKAPTLFKRPNTTPAVKKPRHKQPVNTPNLLEFLIPTEPLATAVDAITALDPASKIQKVSDYAYGMVPTLFERPNTIPEGKKPRRKQPVNKENIAKTIEEVMLYNESLQVIHTNFSCFAGGGNG
jgi:hypothetical protein